MKVQLSIVYGALCCILSLTALTGRSVARDIPPPKLPAKLVELVEQQAVPTISWAIATRGHVSAHTLARRRGEYLPTEEELSFHAASVTKPVTASAVLSLVRDGVISLQAPASSYLKDLTVGDSRWSAVTVEQLLSHTSGLGDVGTGLTDHTNASWHEARGWLEVPGRITFEHDPGVEFSYSNLNYLLLGRIIENVSGQTFADFVTHRSLSPNGAPAARLSCLDLPEEQVAVPHTLDGRGHVVPNQMLHLGRAHAAAGGLCINARELATWAGSLLDCTRTPATLNCDTAADMLRPRLGNYGLGWELREYKGHKFYGHSGSDAGYAAALLVAPKEGISIAVLTDMTFSSAPEFARMLMAQQLDQRIELSNPVPARGTWSKFSGYFVNGESGCARVESRSKGLVLVRQRLEFPYAVTETQLIPKPEWDNGYFIGVYGSSLIWFGAAPRGGLSDPAAASLFFEHQRYTRTLDPQRDCSDLRLR